MSVQIRLPQALYEQARCCAKAENRSIAGQIEYWVKVGRTALDNPDLPVNFIADTLISIAEPRRLYLARAQFAVFGM